jgi:RNA polymerase sigma-70 factor, ECF subfamily
MLTSLFRERSATAEERQEAFEALLKKSYRQAYSLALRLTGNPSEAEDLVQESFVRAFRFFHRYDDSLPFTNWLYRIMSNAHIDSVRRKGRLRLSSLEQPTPTGLSTTEVPDESAAPDRDLWNRSMGERMQAGLGSMTPEFRTAVLLADVEGMAYEEIAEVMGTSVGTVRSRIHRGRKQLRTYLMRRFPQTYGGAYDEL